MADPLTDALRASAVTDWLSFDDPDGDRWMFEVSFLTSNWSCIFGNGCRGIASDPAVGRAQGCCSHGVHLAGVDDRDTVAAAVERLPRELWENFAEAPTAEDVFVETQEGETKTVTHQGACIFLNSPEFHTGAGCALHFAAMELGGTHPEWKPEACWQLPLRLEFAVEGGEGGRTVFMLRRWDRKDWGEAGEDFDWWCTDTDDAFGASEPVYEALEAELRTMLGSPIYEAMVGAIRSRQRKGSAVPVELGSRQTN